jgi:hypothetical protein
MVAVIYIYIVLILARYLIYIRIQDIMYNNF